MKLVAIMNPRARNGHPDALIPALRAEFGDRLVRIEEPSDPEQGRRLTRKAAEEGADTIIAIGGDGTVNAVVNGLLGTQAALAVIPTGTANDLATLYGIPADLRRACAIIRKRHMRSADLISVNDRCYMTVGGFGLPCTAARIADTLKRRTLFGITPARLFGANIYLLAALLGSLQEHTAPVSLTIQQNRGPLTTQPLSLTFANQPFAGKAFLISPGAVNDDGLFDICLIERPSSRMQALHAVLQVMRGSHMRVASVKTWRAADVTVTSQRSIHFFGDGEVLAQAREFRIQLHPKAVSLIAPFPVGCQQRPGGRSGGGSL